MEAEPLTRKGKAPTPEGVRLRLILPGGLVLGPGKAALLAGIAVTGSISAAGRGMSMSYRRAWMLVEEMNAAFATPLVAATRGGSAGGGATLTETGERILALYQRALTKAEEATSAELDELRSMLADRPTMRTAALEVPRADSRSR